MNFLPIKSIYPEDLNLVGENLVKLGILKRLGFPVAEGIVLFPPFKLKIPEDIASALKKHSVKNIQKIWEKLVSQKISKPIAFFFTDKVFAKGTVQLRLEHPLTHLTYQLPPLFKFDSDVRLNEGRISVCLLHKIDKLTYQMDKTLGISKKYHWIATQGKEGIRHIEIVGISEPEVKLKLATQIYDTKEHLLPPHKETTSRNTIKLFVENPSSDSSVGKYDGVILDSKQFRDSEQKMKSLCTIAKLTDYPVIFRLSDIKKDAEALLFARYKKALQNIQVAISEIESVDKFLFTKTELASLKVTRGTGFKLWLDLTTPENLLNIEDYLLAGLDGVLLSLDKVSSYLLGDYNTLLKFLDDGVRILIKGNIMIVAYGKLTYEDEVLEYLISKGIWAVAINEEKFLAFDHKLNWAKEKTQRLLLA